MMDAKVKDRPPGGKNALEWTVFGLSVLLVLAVIGLLAREALRWKESPARLRAELGTPVMQDGSWWVPVKVRNEGESLAADVTIEVRAGGETSGFTLDFVPRGTDRQGRANFPGGTDMDAATVIVKGYQEP